MLNSGDLEFSFSGLKTAVLTLVKEGKAGQQGRYRRRLPGRRGGCAGRQMPGRAETDRTETAGGGRRGRRQPGLARSARRGNGATALPVFYPPLELCTDNGAMIAFAGGMRLRRP
jgi:N6-L-threonylcarbamoyladenine synthase